MNELEHIKEVQDALGAIKRHLRAIEKINQQNGELAASNTAMKFRGQVIVLHAEMTEGLESHDPGFARDIQERGGGGR